VTKAPHYANFPQHPFGQHVAVKNIWYPLPASNPETHQPLCTKWKNFLVSVRSKPVLANAFFPMQKPGMTM
jgi:hypothetical protein